MATTTPAPGLRLSNLVAVSVYLVPNPAEAFGYQSVSQMYMYLYTHTCMQIYMYTCRIYIIPTHIYICIYVYTDVPVYTYIHRWSSDNNIFVTRLAACLPCLLRHDDGPRHDRQGPDLGWLRVPVPHASSLEHPSLLGCCAGT